MRDHDRSADDERDVEDFEEFLVACAVDDRLVDVIRDAVIAAQDHRRAEPEEFFGFGIDRAGLVRVAIEGEEPLGGLGASGEDLLVELGPELLKLVVSVHGPV